MKILIDTNIWSLALRRRAKPQPIDPITEELRILLEATELPPLPDIIRLELLAGITPIDRQKQISRNLDKFPPLKQSVTDFNLAAEYFSICVMKGVTPDLVDVLLCAIAVRRRMKIFTKDRDFLGYEKHLPIKLYLRDLTFPQT